MSNSQLDEVRKTLENITDKLGKHIDPGIFDTVLYLNALGINTVGSCEGHIDWGEANPWIDIEPKETPTYISLVAEIRTVQERIDNGLRDGKSYSELQNDQSKNLELTSKLINLTLEEGQKINKLLSNFYKERQIDYGRHLVLRTIGRNTIRLESANALFQDLSDKEKAENLLVFKDEMKLFTNFLKKTYEKVESIPQS